MTAPQPTPQDEVRAAELARTLHVRAPLRNTAAEIIAEQLALVRAEEMEACAKIADSQVDIASKAADDAKVCDEDYHQSYGAAVEAKAIASAIRASGEK